MPVSITFAPAKGASDRLVMIAAPREGSTTVTGIPSGCGPRAMLKLARVVFWPVPSEITYDRLMSYRDGQIVREG